MDLKRLSSKAKDLVDKRGGADSLKQDAEQLKEIAKGPGSIGDKAKAAVSAIKDPGADEPEAPAAEASAPAERSRAERKVEGEHRGKHKHAGEGQRRKGRGQRREGRGDGDAAV